MFFLLNAITETASAAASASPSIGFGDWPAWIALIAAIVASPVTTIATNIHQRKMLKLQQDFERSKSCDKLISELASLTTISPSEFTGFSKEALEATRYLTPNTLSLFLDFSNELLAMVEAQKHNSIYRTFGVISFQLLPDRQDPAKKKRSSCKEICMLIINELKNATSQK